MPVQKTLLKGEKLPFSWNVKLIRRCGWAMFDKYVTKGSSSYKISLTSNFVKKWHISLFSFSVEEFDSALMKRVWFWPSI